MTSGKFLIEKKDDLEVLLSKTDVNLNRKQLKFLLDRSSAHFLRLIAPEEYSLKLKEKPEIYQKIQNNVCSKFTEDFLNYLSKLKEVKNEKLLAFQRIAGGEGEGTVIFWTFSPYIHLELSKLEKDAEKSIEKIFLWLENVYQRADELEKRGSIYAFFKNNFDYTYHLRNFSKDFNIETKNIILGFDERLPSHLLARLLAKKIAKEIHGLNPRK